MPVLLSCTCPHVVCTAPETTLKIPDIPRQNSCHIITYVGKDLWDPLKHGGPGQPCVPGDKKSVLAGPQVSLDLPNPVLDLRSHCLPCPSHPSHGPLLPVLSLLTSPAGQELHLCMYLLLQAVSQVIICTDSLFFIPISLVFSFMSPTSPLVFHLTWQDCFSPWDVTLPAGQLRKVLLIGVYPALHLHPP